MVAMDNWFDKSSFFNRTPSRLEAHLVYKHTQKPDFLISNVRLYSQFYGTCFVYDAGTLGSMMEPQHFFIYKIF